jgi:hypothetical protein
MALRAKRELSQLGRPARVRLWRLDVFDGDLWFVSEAHGEFGEMRSGLERCGDLADADRDGR